MRKLLPLLALSLSCHSPPIPMEHKVPVYSIGRSESHPECSAEVKVCTYYSGLDFGIVSMYKCLTDDGYGIYAKETARNFNKDIPDYKVERWYETKLPEDLSDKEFSEWCKESFLNYRTFREESDK